MEGISRQESFSRIVFLYLLYSITGWLYEVALAFYYGWGFTNRGFLLGPYLPVYGFGALVLILCLGRLLREKKKVNGINLTPPLIFFAVVIITTVIEYATGVALETLFQTRWWDYSHYPYNFQGLVCLSASIRFGLGGMIFLYVLLPLFERLIAGIQKKTRFYLACGVVVVLLIDLILTLSSMG